MARIDLNIVDRGIQGTDWVAEDICLTAERLDEVMEQKTDNSSALNSLPTPFARFFVAREAFRRVMEECKNSSNEAGYAYKQLVSDILDVYEILFNIKYLRNNFHNGEKLELREWNCKENLAHIKDKMPILYNSIDNYYKTDINEEKLYFLVYTENGKDKLLACSSPLTGFVTPADMDKNQMNTGILFGCDRYNELHIKRKSGGECFRNIKLFEERDADFKNYMYNELFGSDKVDSRFKEIKEYIRSFADDKDIRNDWDSKLLNIQTDQNEDLVINGLELKCSDEIDIMNYFTPKLIKIPYRINRECYSAVNFKNDNESRKFDFLMPFKPEIVSLYDNGVIDSWIKVNKTSFTVHLNYKGKLYKKEYDAGDIFDMNGANINFDLGLFPNILSYKERENNYFKVLVVAADEDTEAPNFNIDQISLSFYKNTNGCTSKIEEFDPTVSKAQYGVLPAVIRSRQKTNEHESGTKFYELYNTSFDLIEVNVLGNKGLICPVWRRSESTNETYTYAIDLGTSNTFMSRCKNKDDGTPDLTKRPELFKMDSTMVSFMHEISDNKQYSLSTRIEDSIFQRAKDKIKTEFIPAIIDGSDYKFPIRTALCGIRSTSERPKLFDNHNIAFFYEKYMANEDQNVHTDIKWEQNESLLRVFIRELLLMVKCDILQHNGDLDRTHLVWFRPLSFMGNIRSLYNDLWENEAKDILFIQSGQIDCYSESEAPYYYFKKNDDIRDSTAVAVVDIGGGSTDFVYFQENKPQMANSVHFGCDVLWGNGFNSFGNVRENGIYNKYRDTLRFRQTRLQDLNDCFIRVDNTSTKDIINFWLSNAEDCDIKRSLSQDFKPVFVYHFVSIIYYMATMFKDCSLSAPKTIVFSGNGSKYIDSFICTDRNTLKLLIDLVFNHVYGGEHNVYLELPNERKEATCYGGLYRDSESATVPEKVYQGDMSCQYEKVGDVNANYKILKDRLLLKYKNLTSIYEEALNMLKREHVIDNTFVTSVYVQAAGKDMGVSLDTYYTSQIKEQYDDEVILYDSIFFLPIINRVFEMTKL